MQPPQRGALPAPLLSMARDYKKKARASERESPPLFGGLLSFLSGLSIGLLAAFLVYLYYQPSASTPVAEAGNEEPPQAQETAPEQQLPEPVFDFYKVLPERLVNISESLAEEAQEGEKKDEKGSVAYVLQVGSFGDYKSADQVKARLALMGVFADIQRVVINGQNIRHRVRLGPYKSAEEMKNARELLEANQFDFMVLKLRLEEGAG